MLGNLLEIDGFDYDSSEEVRDELRAAVADQSTMPQYNASKALPAANGADKVDSSLDVPMYRIDPLVRRSTALQLTPEARRTSKGGTA